MNTTLIETMSGASGVLEAIAAVQRAAYKIGKDSKGYNYTYASLPAIMEKLLPLMVANKVWYLTVPTSMPDNTPALACRIMHEDGSSVGGIWPLSKAGMSGANDAQQMGAAITYFRRYCLLALLGIAVDDDDARALSMPSKAEWDVFWSTADELGLEDVKDLAEWVNAQQNPRDALGKAIKRMKAKAGQ